ncbi:MAG: zf-HC2 domain-containing protein [Thiobacillus sp.]|nr:zf-HC2 domain-containing protein [Thiobacillus sp.]
MKWMATCKETTELVSRAMDERLPFVSRLSMQLHLAICKNCTLFARQLQEMRHLFREETSANDKLAGLSPEARQRIAGKLQSKPDA